MNKIIRKIAFVLITVFFAGAITGCELVVAVVALPIELIATTGSIISGTGNALSDFKDASKMELPLYNLKRISKGVYTVDVDAWNYRYSEKQRKNAINLLVQFMGYESYDFKMTREPSWKKKTYNTVWSYTITVPGSIPVVRNDKYTYKITDTILTTVTDTTFGKSDINAIAYGNGKFVAVGEKKMAYSPDGITWTAINNKTINLLFEDIAYGNSKFVAVGYYGGSKIVYSSDGVNWTDVKNTTFKKNSIGSIVYGNGMFIAASKYDDGKLAYSPDGINWTQVKKFPFRKKYINLAYCEGKFFVFDRYDNGNLAYSSDGINWTAVDSPFGKKNIIVNITSRNGKFVAVGYGKIAYSSDGINWTVVAGSIYVPIFPEIVKNDNGTYASFSSNIYISNGITYGNGKFVAVGGGGKMAFSSDGITWITISDSTFNLSNINDIVYENGKFIAVGNDGKMVYWDGNIE